LAAHLYPIFQQRAEVRDLQYLSGHLFSMHAMFQQHDEERPQEKRQLLRDIPKPL
jgi:hypothetical protein